MHDTVSMGRKANMSLALRFDSVYHPCPHIILRDMLCLWHVVCFARRATPSRCGCATASLPAGVLRESTIHPEASSSF